MKTLVVINGVTGAIGTACLARFSREANTTIYGLSRQALPVEKFSENGKLKDHITICSVGDVSDKKACDAFVEAIDVNKYSKIIYIHALGIYPFELDNNGEIHVSHDNDGDGIDDRVVKLSHDAFFAMTSSLRQTGLPLKALIFGGIADKHQPVVHKSWWRVIEKIKKEMDLIVNQDSKISFFVLNISSVICPHEILTRPFVFQNTNADARFWLMPHEVADRVAELTLSDRSGFTEDELFHKSDYYTEDYFEDKKFTPRKISELGLSEN